MSKEYYAIMFYRVSISFDVHINELFYFISIVANVVVSKHEDILFTLMEQTNVEPKNDKQDRCKETGYSDAYFNNDSGAIAVDTEPSICSVISPISCM